MLIVTEVLNCHSGQILRKTQDIIDGEFHNVVVLRRAVKYQGVQRLCNADFASNANIHKLKWNGAREVQFMSYIFFLDRHTKRQDVVLRSNYSFGAFGIYHYD